MPRFLSVVVMNKSLSAKYFRSFLALCIPRCILDSALGACSIIRNNQERPSAGPASTGIDALGAGMGLLIPRS